MLAADSAALSSAAGQNVDVCITEGFSPVSPVKSAALRPTLRLKSRDVSCGVGRGAADFIGESGGSHVLVVVGALYDAKRRRPVHAATEGNAAESAAGTRFTTGYQISCDTTTPFLRSSWHTRRFRKRHVWIRGQALFSVNLDFSATVVLLVASQ